MVMLRNEKPKQSHNPGGEKYDPERSCIKSDQQENNMDPSIRYIGSNGKAYEAIKGLNRPRFTGQFKLQRARAI